jgi:hypothetical protein
MDFPLATSIAFVSPGVIGLATRFDLTPAMYFAAPRGDHYDPGPSPRVPQLRRSNEV